MSKDNSEEVSQSDEEREMHKAVCSECGVECEVPFKPEEGKPVYCKECYMKKKPRRSFGGRGGGDRFNNRRSFGGRGGDNRQREMHDAKCSACGKNCQVPFKPSGDKPVLCKECYIKKKESER